MGYSEEETAEFDSLTTVEAIAESVLAAGHNPLPIGNIHALTSRLASGERWDLVFNIAEGMYGFAREAQVPALLEAFGIPYTFSDPLTLAVCLHKATAKRLFKSFGVPTPDFALIARAETCRNCSLTYPLFAKPVAEGTGKGITDLSVLHSSAELADTVERLLKKYNQPVLIEEYLPGREYTVGIIGTGNSARAIGTLEIKVKTASGVADEVYSYSTKELCEQLVDYSLVGDGRAVLAGELALRAWNALGCRDAGRVDIREDREGRMQVLELNPLAGLHPEHSDLPILCSLTGIEYGELIEQIIQSAKRRIGNKPEYDISLPR
jgi:D-alanine-D-alanine ligase